MKYEETKMKNDQKRFKTYVDNSINGTQSNESSINDSHIRNKRLSFGQNSIKY